MDKKIYYYLDKVESLLEDNPEMPVTVEIDPSNRCSLDCSFCPFRVSSKAEVPIGEVQKPDLDYDLYQSLLLDLKRISVKSITFTGGGEPTCNPKFNEMVRLADKMEFEYGLVTNGLKLHKVCRSTSFKFIQVSLDSATAATYQKLKCADCFHKVRKNIKNAVASGASVGISFVVNETNKEEISDAQDLAKDLGVDYIEFKPDWSNGELFTDYKVPNIKGTIDVKGFTSTDRMPCKLAGLVGIVGADAKVYYCAQHRGDRRYALGSLCHSAFPEIWKRRPHLIPDIGRCPNCRYMSYTEAYKDLVTGGSLLFKHRHFL